MKQNLLMALSASFLFAACGNGDELQTNARNEAIEATATLADAIDTPVSRGIIDGLPASGSTLDVKFARLDQTGAGGIYPADYSTAAAHPATIDHAGKVTFSPTLYYLTNDEVGGTKLVGWLPATGTYNAGTVTFGIDGKTDVLLSNEKTGSRTNKFGTNDFTFNHQLTQFVVKAYAADAVSAGTTGKWGKITKIEFLNQPNQCVITLPGTASGSVVTSGSASVALKAPAADTDMADVTLAQKASSSEAVECGYAILAPTTGKTITLKVTTDTGIGQEVPVSLKQDSDTYLAGKKYTIVLKFSVAGIDPAGTAITAWSEDGVVNPDEITM